MYLDPIQDGRGDDKNLREEFFFACIKGSLHVHLADAI
jgi:hypothetical protein